MGKFIFEEARVRGAKLLECSVTSLGDLFNFGQVFKAFGNN